MSGKRILVTGGAGYIGSHTCLELLNAGYEVIALDNLVNSNKESLSRVEEITGKSIDFFQLDLNNYKSAEKLFLERTIDAVIHFAGYKAVGESVKEPLLYYKNNVSATINLLELMQKYHVSSIVFSSSCTVYGDPDIIPVKETDPLNPTNPYGRSKRMVEQILQDFYEAEGTLSVSILRYFNPIGAHPSGKIGEDPKGIPNNLMPYVAKVAANKLDELQIFGDDYDTKDGTGVRDYIHVVDLSVAHVIALKEILANGNLLKIYNLGTGEGYSVLEIVNMFKQVSGKDIPFKIVERREGDVSKIYADPSKANIELDWEAEKDLYQMCNDAWRWQSNNPNGYQHGINA